MATQLAERRENPLTVIRQNLQAMAPEFKAALPAHVSVEKFTRVAQTAIQNNPDLAQVDRRSLFGAIVRLAQDGLLPDGREAAIVKFGDKAQAMPMIAGILKKIRQSGEVAYVSAQVVYEKDHFVWKLGFEEDVEHTPPSLEQSRGKAIGAYATAVLKDGSRLLEVMSLEEIEKVRAVSRSKGAGPWVQWWGEMARKTVMRRLSKRLPMSSDLEDQLDRDDTLDHELRPHEPATVVAVPANRLDALEHQIQGDDAADDDPTEGRADRDMGDAHDGTAADLTNAINAAPDEEAVDLILSDNRGLIDTLPEARSIRATAAARKIELKGQPA
ncbi:MAG: recombinase RecT [Devosia sp.]|uniref:recombinase RecT n=1 Tax=Devosia sp. TaxID=1871048 RepID=UPI0033978B75